MIRSECPRHLAYAMAGWLVFFPCEVIQAPYGFYPSIYFTTTGPGSVRIHPDGPAIILVRCPPDTPNPEAKTMELQTAIDARYLTPDTLGPEL